MQWYSAKNLLISSNLGGFCLNQLLTWVKWHFNEPDQLGQDVMSSEDPYSHPNYWPTVSFCF